MKTVKKVELTPEALKKRLQEFEAKYNLPSNKFYSAYVQGSTDENLDYMKWAAYYEMAIKAGVISMSSHSS